MRWAEWTKVWDPGKEEVEEHSDEVEWSDREVEQCKSLELEDRVMQYIVEQKKSVFVCLLREEQTLIHFYLSVVCRQSPF